MLAAVLVFAASVWIALGLGAVFIPKLDEGSIALQAWRLPSVSLEQSIKSTTQIERVLRQFPEMSTVVSKTGHAEIATDPEGVETSDIFVMLQPHESVSPWNGPWSSWAVLKQPEDKWETIRGPDKLLAVLRRVHGAMTGEQATVHGGRETPEQTGATRYSKSLRPRTSSSTRTS